MRKWRMVLLVALVLAAYVSGYSKQQTIQVSVLNFGGPRYVDVEAGTDVVIVKHGFAGVDPSEYNSIKDLVKSTPIFFSLDARDESGTPIKVGGPKLEFIYQPEHDTWIVHWKYQIKVKGLPSGTYILRGTWTTQEGTVWEQLDPTFMTVLPDHKEEPPPPEEPPQEEPQP